MSSSNQSFPLFQVVVLYCCWYGTSYLCISKANIGHILTYNAYRRVRDIVYCPDDTLTPKNNLEEKEGKIHYLNHLYQLHRDRTLHSE